MKLNVIIGQASKDDLISHIVFLSKNLYSKTYQKGNFLVLPYLTDKNVNSVYFPDLDYPAEYWKTIADLKMDGLHDLVTGYLYEILSPKIKNINVKDFDWKKYESKYFDLLFGILDFEDIIKTISEIKVVFSPYGTMSSFSVYEQENKYSIKIVLRQDATEIHLARAILLALYRIQTKTRAEVGDGFWSERRAWSDFMIRHTKIAKVFPNHFESKSTPEDRLNSQKYLKKLGLITEMIDLDVKMLTKQERSVWQVLISNQGKVVTLDQIAECLWHEKTDEKYSLYAITKVIENLRKKIVTQSFRYDVINTARNEGYFV